MSATPKFVGVVVEGPGVEDLHIVIYAQPGRMERVLDVPENVNVAGGHIAFCEEDDFLAAFVHSHIHDHHCVAVFPILT